MRRHLAYAAGAAVLALAGCGGDDPTPQVADPTPSASVSASPSASAAVEKEAWEKKTDDGAVAFVEHWLEVFNEMQVTGERSDLRAISSGECQSCANIFEKSEEIYGAGGSIQTKGWSVDQIGISPGLEDDERQVAVRVRQTPQTVMSADGEKTKFPGGPLTVTATVAWSGNEWTMQELALQS